MARIADIFACVGPELREQAESVLGQLGYDESISLPADEIEIKRFSEVFYEIFNIDVPQSYLEFLRQCNGFEFNGCIIYSSQNIIENQLDYSFLTNDYIVFAEYDIAWFCMERSSGKCCELDKPSAQEVCTFNTFEEMIKYILRLSINL